MPLKRSRPLTEEKFQNAVIELIAEAGLGAIGINAVAQRAGADKVLIYRYFGDLDGLWQRVADSRDWLPARDQLISEIQGLSDPAESLRRIANETVAWINRDEAVQQLMAWRKAAQNPLTEQFNDQWHQLWSQLSGALSEGLDFDQRRKWASACELLALVVEAQVRKEIIDSAYLKLLASDLELGSLSHISEDAAVEETLPTNLL